MTTDPACSDHVEPVRVGIVPAQERRARARLLDALEAMYPVRFEPREAGDLRGLDALITIGAAEVDTGGSAAHSLPTLAAAGDELLLTAARPVLLADDEGLERPLRGARVHDRAEGRLPSQEATGGGTVLASVDGRPAWLLRKGAGAHTHVVAAFPDELAAGELLRERLLPGRCLALLALTHFVRGLTAARDWRPPPLRAAIILDDPNLHWPTYGHLRYQELLEHAARHRYHLAVAMIPLDAWLVHPGAARLFREGADRLSILVHGNDHDGGELGRVSTVPDGQRLAAHALRRIERFERRSGVPVSRVMVPPHERITDHALRGLVSCGFEAVSTARPFPWLEAEGASWLIHPDGADPLAACTPAYPSFGGLPNVLRLDFGHPREELVLRAFLGQPLVVYGHHDDLAGGLDVLAEVADQVNRLGEVQWMALGDIVRTSAQTRLEGATMQVRPLARRVAIEVPDGVSELRLVPGPCAAGARALRWGLRGAPQSIAAPNVELEAPIEGPGTYELELVGASQQPPARSRTRLRPLARRIATEGRDRLRAVM
jgi:hypothetical protein